MRIDASGIKRNSNGFYAEMGTRFEISRLIRADAALGVVHRDYEDNSLKDVTALTARGQLAWNVTKLTTVTAEVSTDIGETDQAGTSASIERQTALGIQHELLRNVILSGELRGAFNKAAGGTTKETAFSATLNAEYKLNRNSTLTATAVRTQRDSNQTGGDYVENTLRLGLNLKL